MNILEAEDMIKGLPDQALMQEAQGPSGQVPQYLVVSEIQRRADMRKRHQEQMPKGTVKDQILSGIGGINTPQPQAAPPPMPPQGGMPPQGMPPQGMPPMPPQGIGAMPPPQQMMSGGIIRLQEGGQAPRSRFDQIMQDLLMSQKMNMPNYQMLARAVMPRRDMPDLGMPSREQAMAGDSAKVESIREGLSPMPEGISPLGTYGSTPEEFASQRGSMPSLPEGAGGILSGLNERQRDFMPSDPNMPSFGGIVDSVRQGIAATPFGQVSSAAEQSVRDVYNKDGFGAAVGEAGRGLLGTAASVLPTVAQGYAPAVEGLKSLTQGPANALDQFFTGDTSDPLTIADIFGYSSDEPTSSYDELEEVTVDAQRREGLQPRGDSDAPVITEGIAQAVPNDRSLKDMIGDLGVQRQGLTDQTRQGKTSQTAFDLSDLIAESKKDSMNNALMQLGAGIAGGDLSKGISAAGMAAARGSQRSKDLAIQERLMSYKAGREDLARQSSDDRFERQMAAEESRFSRSLDAKGTQFGQQMDLLERKVDAAIEQNDATSMREAIRAASAELKALLDQGMAMSQDDADRVAALRAIINEFYGAQGLNMTPTSQTSNVDFASLKR